MIKQVYLILNLLRSLKEVKPDSKHTVLSLEHQLKVDVQCTTFRINVVHTTIYT